MPEYITKEELEKLLENYVRKDGASQMFGDLDIGYKAIRNCKKLGTGNVDFVLPTADGTANQVLKTDGNKNLSFDSLSSTPDWQSLGTLTWSSEGVSKTFSNIPAYNLYRVILNLRYVGTASITGDLIGIQIAPSGGSYSYLRYNANNNTFSLITGAGAIVLGSLSASSSGKWTIISDLLIQGKSDEDFRGNVCGVCDFTYPLIYSSGSLFMGKGVYTTNTASAQLTSITVWVAGSSILLTGKANLYGLNL